MTLFCSPAQPEDAHAIRLRKEDSDEVALYGLENPAAALAASLDPLTSVAVRTSSGALVAIGGVTQPTPTTLSPWLLCSDEVSKNPRAAWVLAKRAVAALQVQANAGLLVHNHVSKESAQARAFLTRLGFHIVPSPGLFDFFYLPPSCASQSQ